MPRLLVPAILLVSVMAGSAVAQTSPATPAGSIASHAGWPKARAADVATPEALIAALYDSISGPAGQPRNWNRFRSLFLPDARLIPTRHAKTGAGADVAPMTVEGFRAYAGPILEQGFFERGIHNTTESFGDVVQVFSTYESRKTKDALPYARGINSIQLFYDGTRYWTVTIFWDQESPETPIPAKYLP